MTERLDFSLPQAPKKRRVPVLSLLTFAGVAACLVVLLVRGGGREAPQVAPPKGGRGPSAAELKQLAQDLERRTLWAQAAAVWKAYRERADLDSSRQHRVLYLIAKNLKDAGRYEEAARYLTEAEQYPASDREKRRAARLLLECLSALGKEEVRAYLLRARTVPGTSEKGLVVARIGGDEITVEDLRNDLAQQLAQVFRAAGSADRKTHLKEAFQQAGRQLEDPEVRKQVLDRYLTREVLYREALARGLLKDPGVQKALGRLRKDLLAGELVAREAQRAVEAISSMDLKNHYEAHRDRFVEKEGVFFSFQAFPDEASARAALKDLKEESFRKATAAAVRGEPLAGIGDSAEARALLFALKEGEVAARPIRVGQKWYVFRCDGKRPQRQKSFEEARAEVKADLAAAKRKEAVQRLSELLSRQYQVEVIAENLTQPVQASGGGETKKAVGSVSTKREGRQGSGGTPPGVTKD